MNAADRVNQTSAPSEQRVYEPSMEEILASIRRIIADDQSGLRTALVDDEDLPRGNGDVAQTVPNEPELPARAVFAPSSVRREPAVSAPMASDPKPVETHSADRSHAAPTEPEPESAPPASLGLIAAPQYAMPDAPPPSASPVARPAEVSSPWPVPEPILPSQGRPAEGDSLHQPSPRGVQSSTATMASKTQEGQGGPMSSLFSASTDQSVTAAFNTLAATRLIENDGALKDLARDMLRPMLKDWLDDNLPTLVERLVRAEIERVGRGGR